MLWTQEPEISRYGNKMIPAVKQIAVFLTGWIGFRILALIVQIVAIAIANRSGQDPVALLNSVDGAMITNTVAYISLLIVLVLIINVDFVKLGKSFKNYQSYIAGAVCLVSIFAFTYIYSIFLSVLKLTTTDNANESSLQEISASYKFLSLFVFGIIGPICEELTYRVGLFSYFKRKSRVLAYVITILVFALIHFNFSTDPAILLNEILNLPFYMFAAFAFSFTYEKFGLAGSLTAHIANNLISLGLISVIH